MLAIIRYILFRLTFLGRNTEHIENTNFLLTTAFSLYIEISSGLNDVNYSFNAAIKTELKVAF